MKYIQLHNPLYMLKQTLSLVFLIALFEKILEKMEEVYILDKLLV